MHPIDKRLAFLTFTSAHIELAAFSNHLGARQCLQCRHDVAARVACHHHVERIHLTETVVFAKTECAGCHHHFIEGGGPFAHLDRDVVQQSGVSGQCVIVKPDISGLERYLTGLRGGERKPPDRIGQASINGSYYKNVRSDQGFFAVGNGA